MRALFTTAAAVVALTGCATIITLGDDDVDVSTPGVVGANCELRSFSGAVRARVITPGTIQLDKDSRDLEAVCNKDGFAEGRGVVESGFEPWFLGNILIGGLVGMVIDIATGNINSYDSSVAVYMEPESSPRDDLRRERSSPSADPFDAPSDSDPIGDPGVPVAGDAAVYLGFANSREWADNTAEFLWIAEEPLLRGVRPVVQQRLDPATGQPRFHIYGAGLNGDDALDICDGLEASGYLCRVVEARG